MARIRTIKPDFFRHELLQDLEINHPELKPMLVFEGLWGHCDKNGVFEYKPRQLKLDILPFIDFDMGASLVLLREAKMISLLLHGEKIYGFVPSFRDHQRIHGKESQEPSKFPQVSEMIEWKQQGSTGEATGKQQGRQEGKGREGNRKGNIKDIVDQKFKIPTPDDVGEYMLEIGYQGNPQQFCDHYTANGWMVGRNKMKDWKAAVRTWRGNGSGFTRGTAQAGAKKARTQSLTVDSTAKPAGHFAGDLPDNSELW